MERDRKQKFIVMIALMVAIASMSLGFAAFSTTLNISSSAKVSPNSDNFRVEFCESFLWGACKDGNSDGLILNIKQSDGARSGFGTVSGTSANDLSASFSKPGQYVSYEFTVQNLGEYDSYLRGVSYTPLSNGSYKMCSASGTGSITATDSLVQDACEGIRVSISIGGTSYELGSTDISGHILQKGKIEEVIFKIEYMAEAVRADGPFNILFSDFKFDYSTVDGSGPNLISFIVNGSTYQAEDGMSWEEWVYSDYNVDGFYLQYDYICTGDNLQLLYRYGEMIQANSNMKASSPCKT